MGQTIYSAASHHTLVGTGTREYSAVVGSLLRIAAFCTGANTEHNFSSLA